MKQTKGLKRLKLIATVLLFAMASLVVGSAIASMTAYGPSPTFASYDQGLVVSSLAVFSVLMLQRFLPFRMYAGMPGMHVQAITPEIWLDVIISKLFPDNSILNRVRRLDEFVQGGTVVHMPQAGANLGGEKNRTVFPAGVVQRTDTDLTFALDVYTTNPALLQNAEQAELSYDKMADLLTDQLEWLDETLVADMLYAWSGVGASQILRTTGADSSTNLPPSGTGTRKALTAADVKSAMVALNKQNVSKQNRVALLDSDQFGELLDDDMLKTRDVAKEADYKEGTLIRLYGFDIMERSEVQVFDNTATPVKKAVGAAGAATDNKSSLFFQQRALGLAMGEKQFFENMQDPTYFGDIYSALLRAGGRQCRADGKGIISVVQTA